MNDDINIHDFLPHRFPMLMVDELLHMDTESVTSSFCIREENVFVEDGFFNEAGLIENAAQTCSSIVAQRFYTHSTDTPLIGFISSIKKVKVYQLAKVGSELITKSKLMYRYDAADYSTCLIHCQVYDQNTLLLDGELNLFVQENKQAIS